MTSTGILRAVKFQVSEESLNYPSDEADPKSGVSQAVPRHREIKDFLAKHILKKLVH